MGMIAQAGEQRRPGQRGRAERVYRVVGRTTDQPGIEERRPISAKTINNSLIVLRVARGHALEDGLIATNPAASTAGARERIKVATEQPSMDFLRRSEIPGYGSSGLVAAAPPASPLPPSRASTALVELLPEKPRWDDQL
jgi:hypothetical protein